MLITLTTDFGYGSSYVAAMKGVILTINPAARLVDLAHNIPPQGVRHAAFLLAEASHWFPAGTIHVAVIDPGVGSERRLLYAGIEDQIYIAPDNGLLSALAQRRRPSKIIALENNEFWFPEVSSTFHGRDILAPVAAQLSLGLEPERLGPRVDSIVELSWSEPTVTEQKILGEVLSIDGFGNLITNIRGQSLARRDKASPLRIECEGLSTKNFVRTYADRPPGTLVALIGSSGLLELAIVGGSAANHVGARIGSLIHVSW
jgi:S-adenosylmethionine hydrolase